MPYTDKKTVAIKLPGGGYNKITAYYNGKCREK